MNHSLKDNTLFKRIVHLVGKGIAQFDLIQNNDRILVALSGGKDSWTMLYILEYLRKKAPITFQLIVVHIDQGYQIENSYLTNILAQQNYSFYMEHFDIASIIKTKNKKNDIPCSLCARLRRGALYGYADKYNCNKIALGHHADDFIETFLLNTFFIGKIAAMAPKLISPDKKPTIIRPLVYVPEKDIISFISTTDLKTTTCNCLAGQRESKRQWIKKLILQLENEIPFIRQSLLKSLSHIKPLYLLDHHFSDWS